MRSNTISESPGGDALINCPADITLEPQKALKARRRLPGPAEVKSRMLYVCSFSTNIFLIQLSRGACEEESEVHKHRHKTKAKSEIKKPTPKINLLVTTIADKTNTFVASSSRRNVKMVIQNRKPKSCDLFACPQKTLAGFKRCGKF